MSDHWGYPRSNVLPPGAICSLCGHVGTTQDPVIRMGARIRAGEVVPAACICQYTIACWERCERKRKGEVHRETAKRLEAVIP